MNAGPSSLLGRRLSEKMWRAKSPRIEMIVVSDTSPILTPLRDRALALLRWDPALTIAMCCQEIAPTISQMDGSIVGSRVKYEENILRRSNQTLANYTAFGVALVFANKGRRRGPRACRQAPECSRRP